VVIKFDEQDIKIVGFPMANLNSLVVPSVEGRNSQFVSFSIRINFCETMLYSQEIPLKKAIL
jgi:hypothetical protein